MQLWLWVAWTLVTVLASQNDSIQNIPGYWRVCANVYSRSDWNGFIDPHVEIDPSFHGEWAPAPFSQFAVVVYAYEDRDKLGAIDPEGHKEYVCRNSSIAKGICSEESYGRVLLDSAQSTRYPIISELVEFSDRQQLIKYNVSDSSSYCVATVPVQSCHHATGLDCWISGYKEDKCYLRKDSKCDKIVPAEEDNVTEKLRARVRFRNPFGYLQASKASLPMFYFISSGIYFALLILWLCKCCINRRCLRSSYGLRSAYYWFLLPFSLSKRKKFGVSLGCSYFRCYSHCLYSLVSVAFMFGIFRRVGNFEPEVFTLLGTSRCWHTCHFAFLLC